MYHSNILRTKDVTELLCWPNLEPLLYVKQNVSGAAAGWRAAASSQYRESKSTLTSSNVFGENANRRLPSTRHVGKPHGNYIQVLERWQNPMHQVGLTKMRNLNSDHL